MKENPVFLKAAGKAAGLPAVLLAFGLIASVTLVLAGCGEEDSGGGGGGRILTITGITQSGAVGVNIASQIDSSTQYIVSAGAGTVSNNSVVMGLKTVSNGAILQSDWTGAGEYFVYLQVNSQSPNYFYTGGKTWEQLGITSSTSPSDVNSRLPKYDFPEGDITIPFDQFLETP
ncbi:MAG: hypothetical protein LBH85_06675 [Treponema sp.]|jgi:hypothetical protein|nr:hypothetical protein [Treponema sp.]